MIKFKNVSFKYENATEDVLTDLSLEIKPKEKVVIAGASGSGKSTILQLIAGFIAPNKGEIIIDTKLVSKDGKIIIPPHKRELSMVFQDLALWTHLNVEQNIEFGLKMKKVPKKQRLLEVDKFLEFVDLKGYNKKKVDELSGGEQQRVALARAVVVLPKIILMDEPLSNLDIRLKEQLVQSIDNLQKELGFTLIYVTHDKSEMKLLGDKIISLT